MVGLPDYSSKYINEYCQDIGQEVYNKALKDMYFWKIFFPESFDGTALRKDFFSDILSLTIDENCKKYDSVKCYFEFAFFTSLNIKWIHAGESGKKNRIQNRKKCIEKYVKGNIRANRKLKKFILVKDPVQSDKNFEVLQRYMERFLIGLNNQIRKSIDYGTEIKRKHRVGILDDLNIKVCPYCNRQYIVKLDIDMGRPIGDIDHFYSQHYFSLFALSLYNFVPSCKICNSLFKSDINADIQYPYKMGDACNITFEISDSKGGLSPGNLYGWNDDFILSVVGDSQKPFDLSRAEREIAFFALGAQYKIHKEYVRDFLYKKNMVNGAVISYIQDFFMKQGYVLTEKEIKEILYGFDVDNIDLLEKPLAKLTKDIYEKY